MQVQEKKIKINQGTSAEEGEFEIVTHSELIKLNQTVSINWN